MRFFFSHEKEGGNPRPQSYMQSFRQVLIDCHLEDLGFTGDPFTWKRGQIRERLDRVVVNGAWSVMHPDAVLQHLGYTKSDHHPILLDTEYQDPQTHGGSPKRFEARWFQEKGFNQVVHDTWASAVAAGPGMLARLDPMHKALHAWDINVLKKPKRRLQQAQRDFEAAMNSPLTEENAEIAKELSNLIELLLEQEEVHWMQCSRANWLHHGDRNTSFFHNFARARRKKNFIKKLRSNETDWVEGTANLKPMILEYFDQLFTSEVQATDPAVLEKFQPRVSHDMNEKLTSPFFAEDVRKGVFSIGDYTRLQVLTGCTRYFTKDSGGFVVMILPLKFSRHSILG
jgi:hypothetical protein